MTDSKFFGTPFGATGDRATIPEAVDPGGAVSYQQGFGPDYELDPASDPGARPVPRSETNEYLYQITNALKFLQLYGLPEWYATDGLGNPVSYPQGARVRYNAGSGVVGWTSLIAANTAVPGTDATKWIEQTTKPGILIGRWSFFTAGVSTYTPTPGTRAVLVEVVGGGGAGGGAAVTGAGQVSVGGGGGSGAYAKAWISSGFSGVSVTVGAAGVGIAGGEGGDGGTSSFGALVSCPGGLGGGASGAVSAPYAFGGGEGGGQPSGSALRFVSTAGSSGQVSTALSSVAGFGAPGGSSLLGAGGGTTAIFNNGGAAGGSGGGGSGTVNGQSSGAARAGGNGRPGLVIVWEYA